MAPTLNWRELEYHINQLRPELEGLFVDRILVPERNTFPAGYLKGEWAFRLTGRKGACTLIISIRARHPYIYLLNGKGPKAAAQATRSPFDLHLSKHLDGAKLLKCQTLTRDRTAIFWFSEEGNPKNRLGLVLALIPAAPEAFLVSCPNDETLEWPILARSRTIRNENQQETTYRLPDHSQAPLDPPLREELFQNLYSFTEVIEKELKAESFTLRSQIAEKSLKQLYKQAHDRFKQSDSTLREAHREENWQRLGDLLKGTLGDPSSNIINNIRHVTDYTQDEIVAITCDPKLTLKEQIEKFYQNAKRKQRRILEATARAEQFKKISTRIQSALDEKLAPDDWQRLIALEALAGIQHQQSLSTSKEKPSKKKAVAWLGKSFTSREGLMIYVGRSKDENLELTFKHARGNDLWMHVRGRPGAHIVIPVQPGKSVSLETLLDAANLTIYYSGGERWGKTEIDYTFKKFVKKIKDSSEVSYTHNKTLFVEPDRARLSRLLGQD